MARTTEVRPASYTQFGGGGDGSWLRVLAPYDPTSRTGAGLADKPGGLVLEAVSDAGVVTTYWLWIDSNGLMHLSSSEPTNQDETTTYTGPKNVRISTLGIDPNATILSGSVVVVSTTITGVAAGDLVLVERAEFAAPHVTGYVIDQIARVSANDTIAVVFRNIGPAVTPEPETIRYTWFDFT